jgi:hypothetical protein
MSDGSYPLKKRQQQNLILLVGAFGLFFLYSWYIFHATGIIDDDVIAHYLIAKWSWKHPELFFDVWGRPTYTILYAPVAPLGLTAVHVYSAALTALTSLGSVYLARSYKLQWYWLALPFTGLQPEFVRQGFSGLTELSFAFCLCWALIAYQHRRWGMLALAAGFLPLARYENLPIMLLFLIVLIQNRRYRESALLFTPMLAWNISQVISSGSWTQLIFPLNRLLGQHPTPVVFDYGSGSLFYYIQVLPLSYGAICVVLAVAGMFRLRFGLLHLCFLIPVTILSVSYWAIPETGIAGYSRHLAAISPVVGVLAVAGVERSMLRFNRSFLRWTSLIVAIAMGVWLFQKDMLPGVVTSVFIAACILLQGKIKPVAAWIAIGLLPLMLVSTLRQIQPPVIQQEQSIMLEAAQWYKDNGYTQGLTLASHAWFCYGSGIDIYDRKVFRHIKPEEIAQAPSGSIIVWDSHYSHRLIWKTPLTLLQDTTRFRELKVYQGQTFAVHIFQKL